MCRVGVCENWATEMNPSITIRTTRDRSKLDSWIARVPDGWTVTFRAPSRSADQNARLWELLNRVAKRLDLGGRKYDADAWKCIFMQAMGREVAFLPTLDGSSFFPSGLRSSTLTVQEMAELQTFIEAECAERGVDIWNDT